MSLLEKERIHLASPCNLQQKLNIVLETYSYFVLFLHRNYRFIKQLTKYATTKKKNYYDK